MITLEISSTDIRLMETEGGRVTKWANRSLEPDMLEDGVISDFQAAGAAIKQLINSSGVRGGRITAGVSGLYSLSRIVMVPVPLGGQVNQEAVLEATREVMPLSEEELYISWQSLGVIEGGQQVLVVAVPQDIIDGEMQALKAAGVNIRVLDLKSMALVRAVNREQALILNIEAGELDMVVVAGGVAEIMYTSAWQHSDLSIDEKVEHLAMSLERTVGFYNSHHPGLPFDPATPLFITGQMSGDLSLIERLQESVGYSIEQLAPLLDYPPHFPVSQYAVNIGLALKGAEAPQKLGQSYYSPPDINLLPQEYQPWKPSPRQIYFAVAIVAAIALLFPLYQVTTGAMAETAGLKARYEILNTELKRRQTELAKRTPLQGAINEYNTILNMGGGFVEDLEVIRAIAGELGVEVGSISHVGGSIAFACQTDDYMTFRQYKAALEESGRFFTPITPPEGYPYVKGGSISLQPKPSE